MKPPRLTDTTLRDGSHPMRHQFTRQQVATIVQALDRAGVPVIEVSHGDGLAGSSLQYGFSHTSEFDLIETARQNCCPDATGHRHPARIERGGGPWGASSTDCDTMHRGRYF